MIKLSLLLFLKLPFVLAVLLSLAYGGICLFLFKQQHRIIFFPSSVITATPLDVDLPYQDVWIPVSDNVDTAQIHGWWMPSQQANANGLLYLHGNGENMGANVSKAAWFHSLGFSVFMIDYRGYGLSDGDFPTEAQVYEDAEIAWNYMIQELQVPPDRSFVFGHSLGGAIAIELATRMSTMAGLIIEGSFTSMLDMSDRTKNYGFLPIDFLLTQRFDSLAKVRSLTIPVLYVHGTADKVVPTDMSETLYAATQAPKELLLIPNAGHGDVVAMGDKEYAEAIAWLTDVALHPTSSQQ